jgi:aspartate-semialdehyde dehydrogenase
LEEAKNMAGKIVRAAVVGASSLLGKELARELNGSDAVVWDLTLLDAEISDPMQVGGQITSAGDEAALIQAIAPGAFAGIDVVLFAGSAATTEAHWKEAMAAGAALVDASGALYGVSAAKVRSPWVDGSEILAHSSGEILIAAHPAAVMLGIVVSRLRKQWPDVRVVATVMEPASQEGSAGLDEMHQQTIALLSFQSVPKDVYGTQVAFNMSVSSPAEAKVSLREVSTRVHSDLASIAGEAAADSVALQFVQASVFNGYTASAFVELDGAKEEVEAALRGGLVSVAASDDEAPSNLSASEQGQLLVSVCAELAGSGVRGYWLWMAVDNLRLAALNAAACASELVASKS